LKHIIEGFKPEFIFVSAGFDSGYLDPLGGIGVTPLGYSYIINSLQRIQNKICVVLEGGYNINTLKISSYAVCQSLVKDYNNIIYKLNNKEYKFN